MYRFFKLICLCFASFAFYGCVNLVPAMYSGNPFCCDNKYLSEGEKRILENGALGMASGTISGGVKGAIEGGMPGAVYGASLGAVGGWTSGAAKGLYESSKSNGGECVIC